MEARQGPDRPLPSPTPTPTEPKGSEAKPDPAAYARGNERTGRDASPTRKLPFALATNTLAKPYPLPIVGNVLTDATHTKPNKHRNKMPHQTPILTHAQREIVLQRLARLERNIAAAEAADKYASVEHMTDLRDALDIALATCDASKAGHPTQFSTADLIALRIALPEIKA